MTSGWLFLAFTTPICIGVFLNGLRFSRMKSNPWASRKIGNLSIGGSKLPIRRVQLLGHIQMIAAVVMLLFLIALCFGLLGPVHGIQIIRL